MPVTTVETKIAAPCIALEPIWNLSLPKATISAQNTVRIGSAQEMDFVAALQGVADFHCEVEICHRGRAIVRPQNHHPVWINDDPVIGEDLLSIGDRIAVGPAIFRVISEEASLSSVSLLNQIAQLQAAPAKSADLTAVNTAAERKNTELRAQEEDLRQQTQLFQEQQRSLLERQAQFDEWVGQAEQRLRNSERRLVEDREEATRLENHAAIERREAARQLSEAESQSEQLKREQEKLRGLADQLASDAEQLEQERAKFESHLKEQTDEAARLKADAEKQAAAKADESTALREECDRLKGNITELELKLAESVAAADDLNMVNSTQLQDTVDEQRAAIAQLEAQLTAHNAIADQQDMNTEVERLRLEDTISGLQAKLQKTIVDAESERGLLEFQANELQSQLDVHLDELLKVEDSLRQVESSRDSEKLILEEQLAALQEQIEQQSEDFGRVDAAQDASLRQREIELTGRIADLEKKEAELQQLRDEVAIAQATAEDERQADREKLAAAAQESESLRAENEEYALALQELKQAFEAARDELQNRQLIETADSQTAVDDEYKPQLQQLRTELEAAEAKLAASLAEQETRDTELTTLRDQLERLTQAFQAQQQELENRIIETAARGAEEDNGHEEKWQQEIERLTAELEAARRATDEVRETLNAQLEEHRSTIARLAAELEVARADLDAASKQNVSEPDSGAVNHEEAAALIAELTERLQEQQQIIERLTETPDNSGAGAEPVAELEEVRTLHKELDDRTIRLDSREEDLGERQRVVENQEAELENQRRELLEARQQLELARAEIHSAIEPAERLQAIPDEPTEDAPEAGEIRSEFAELFGIDAATISAETNDATSAVIEAPSINLKPPVSVAETDLPAVDDYSQEASAAVSISFGNEASLLQGAEPLAEPEAVNSEHQDAEAAVADYMEKLLARTRGHAGEAVVEELKTSKPSTSTTQPTVNKQESLNTDEQKPAQQKSFIDAYMSGEYNDDSDSTAVTAPTAVPLPAENPAVETRTTPRTKIDLDALRNNMTSFREISTKSVESALATHARQQEKGGVQATKGLFFAFLVMSVFVLAAAIVDVIPFGLITIGVFAPTLITGLYLAYKSSQIREKVRKANDSLKSGELEADYAGNLQSANQVAPETIAEPMPATTMMDPPSSTVTPQTATQPVADAEVLDVEDLIEDQPDAAVQGPAVQAETSPIADFAEPEKVDLPNLELPPHVAELLPQIEADSTAPPVQK